MPYRKSGSPHSVNEPHKEWVPDIGSNAASRLSVFFSVLSTAFRFSGGAFRMHATTAAETLQDQSRDVALDRYNRAKHEYS
jgi:hypothetical protein